MVETLTSKAKQINDMSQFRTERIDEIINYLIKKIFERKIMSRKSKKYIAAFY